MKYTNLKSLLLSGLTCTLALSQSLSAQSLILPAAPLGAGNNLSEESFNGDAIDQGVVSRIHGNPEAIMALRNLFYKTNQASALISQIAQPNGIERGFRSYTAKENIEEGLFHVGATLGMILNPLQGIMFYGISCMIHAGDQPFDQFAKVKQFNEGLADIRSATLVLQNIEDRYDDESGLSSIVEALGAPLASKSQSKISRVYEETRNLTKGSAKDGFFVSAKRKVERRLARLKSKTGDKEDMEGRRFSSAYRKLYRIYMQAEQTKDNPAN